MALAALGLAALFGLPHPVSDCAHQSPMPRFGAAVLFMAVWACAGLYAVARGDSAQRTILFAGTIIALLGYGYALSLNLPIILRDGVGC